MKFNIFHIISLIIIILSIFTNFGVCFQKHHKLRNKNSQIEKKKSHDLNEIENKKNLEQKNYDSKKLSQFKFSSKKLLARQNQTNPPNITIANNSSPNIPNKLNSITQLNESNQSINIISAVSNSSGIKNNEIGSNLTNIQKPQNLSNSSLKKIIGNEFKNVNYVDKISNYGKEDLKNGIMNEGINLIGKLF